MYLSAQDYCMVRCRKENTAIRVPAERRIIGKTVRIRCSPRYCMADGPENTPLSRWTGRPPARMKPSQEACPVSKTSAACGGREQESGFYDKPSCMCVRKRVFYGFVSEKKTTERVPVNPVPLAL